ncbi:MAG: sigma-70 family RNA polymerase sigma factor [Geobacteraceae bacterium]|nr:sigma-70 family RNA polymerase sigma factor [Geobacteraceae bacterium]
MRDFASIYREFQPRIQRYLVRFCGEADAPDLTQAVFLKVSQALDGFRGESSLATWIYRIATNTAHDHALSSRGRQREAELPLEDAASPDDLLDPDVPGADREYIRREMNACIRGIVDKLPENYRTVLLLSDFEEFTNQEIAEILGLSLDTVKIRLHRARATLRKAMECQCSLYHDERNELMCDRKGEE